MCAADDKDLDPPITQTTENLSVFALYDSSVSGTLLMYIGLPRVYSLFVFDEDSCFWNI